MQAFLVGLVRKYAIKFLLWLGKQIAIWLAKARALAKIDKKIEGVAEAEKMVDEANKIEGDDERLKKKQEAAKHAEKALSDN
jgi:hypothetical protein